MDGIALVISKDAVALLAKAVRRPIIRKRNEDYAADEKLIDTTVHQRIWIIKETVFCIMW